MSRKQHFKHSNRFPFRTLRQLQFNLRYSQLIILKSLYCFLQLFISIILQVQHHSPTSFYFRYPTLCDFPFFSPHFVTLPIQLLAIRYNVFYIFAIITDKPNRIIHPNAFHDFQVFAISLPSCRKNLYSSRIIIRLFLHQSAVTPDNITVYALSDVKTDSS